MVKVELTFLVPSSVGEMVNSHGKPIGFIGKSRFSSQNQPGSFKQRRVEWSVPIILARLIGGTYSRRLFLGLYYEFFGDVFVFVQNKFSKQILGPSVVIGFSIAVPFISTHVLSVFLSFPISSG